MAKKPSTEKPTPRPYAVYLLKQTPKGAERTLAQRKASSAWINEQIREAGGTCALFGNKKVKPDEWVSIVRGLSPAGFRKMVEVMEREGNTKALMLHIFKGP